MFMISNSWKCISHDNNKNIVPSASQISKQKLREVKLLTPKKQQGWTLAPGVLPPSLGAACAGNWFSLLVTVVNKESRTAH